MPAEFLVSWWNLETRSMEIVSLCDSLSTLHVGAAKSALDLHFWFQVSVFLCLNDAGYAFS